MSKEKDEIAVAVKDSTDQKGSILNFNSSGQCLNVVINKRLFTNTKGEVSNGPWNMVQNINRDIIVSNVEVTAFDQTGKFRFNYVGSGNTKSPFDSRGI